MHNPVIDRQIERLIDQALAERLVTFNRHGVGSFDIASALLPDGIAFDRLGLYDTGEICSGNGCAQVRSRKGRVSITFSIDPVVEYAG